MEIRHPGLANLSLTEEENEKAYIAYLTWATKTHQPLQQCADNHFRNMLSKLTKDQFAVGCVKTYIKRLEIVYRQEQEKKITQLQRTPGKVSYTSDLWSDKKMRHFAVVTAHWIDEDWALQSTILDFIPLKADQTSRVVSQYIWDTICKYGLQQKSIAITTDNGTNMINATQNRLAVHLSAAGNTKFMGTRCCAHIINIGCQEVLKVAAGPISKVRQASKKVLSSGQQTERLKSLCSEHDEAYVSLSIDCYTRWNSSLRMIDSAYRMRRSLDSLFNGLLTEAEWLSLKGEIDFLTPFKEAVDYLESEKRPTTPAIIPMFEKLSELVNNRPDNLGLAMKAKLGKYWPSEYFEEYQLHAFLHPACRRYVFPEETRAEGLNRLKRRYLLYAEDDSSLDHGTCFSEMVTKHGHAPASRDEFMEYAFDSLATEDDPLEYWKHERRFPTVARLARDHLAVQATSAASERAFSRAKRVVSDQRTQLKEETVRMLMCLQSWLPS